MWLRPHQVFGAQTGFCRDGALHQSLGVDPVITPAYHRLRNRIITGSEHQVPQVVAFRLPLPRSLSVAAFWLAGRLFGPAPLLTTVGGSVRSTSASARPASPSHRRQHRSYPVGNANFFSKLRVLMSALQPRFPQILHKRLTLGGGRFPPRPRPSDHTQFQVNGRPLDRRGA